MWPWYIAVIAVVSLVILSVYHMRKERHLSNHYVIFIMGIIFAVSGIPLQNYLIFLLGIALMIAGLKNRKNWRLSGVPHQKEKRLMMWILLLIALQIVLGFVAFIV